MFNGTQEVRLFGHEGGNRSGDGKCDLFFFLLLSWLFGDHALTHHMYQ